MTQTPNASQSPRSPNQYIAVIDPATRVVENECFNTLVSYAPLPAQYHLPAMQGMRSLEEIDLDQVAAVVIFGSGSSVLDKIEWQTGLRHWLERAMAKNLPIAGLCYGHQLVAHIAGAQVDFIHPDRRKEVGWREVTITETRAQGLDKRTGPVVVSHREHIVTCPDGWKIIGSSKRFPIEAIAHKNAPFLGVQGHPEAVPAFLRNQSINIVIDHNNTNDISHDPSAVLASEDLQLISQQHLQMTWFDFGHQLIRDFLGHHVGDRARPVSGDRN